MSQHKMVQQLVRCFLVIFLSSFNMVLANGDEIKISATTIRPGDFIKITASVPTDLEVSVKFLGCTKRLIVGNNQYMGLLASSYYTKLGMHPLEVTIIKDGQSSTRIFNIEVIKRVFPEDRIWVQEKKRKEILTTENINSDTKTATNVRQKAKIAAEPPLWEGQFIWPLKGKLTTSYGLIRYVNDIENGRHSGIDIAAPKGTPIAVCNSGRVIFAGNLYLTGLTVIVYHGLDLFTTYGHMSAIQVKEGDEVRKGDTVGLIGATGLATGPHLHLTFRIGDIPVDPNLFLGEEVKFD